MNDLFVKIKNNPWKLGLLVFIICTLIWGFVPFILVSSFFSVLGLIIFVCGVSKDIALFFKQILQDYRRA